MKIKNAQVSAGGQCPRRAPPPIWEVYKFSSRLPRISPLCSALRAQHLFSDSTCTDLKGLRIRTERFTFGLLRVYAYTVHLLGSLVNRDDHSE